MTARDDLLAHLESGTTTVCHAWAIHRRDGGVHGFTDHDEDLSFDGIDFRAGTGLTAKALQQSTGLSVDNSEAVGAFSDLSVTETDINAGRFDDARLTAWLVNWQNPEERMLRFRGSIGEISHAGVAFRAELRGLSEALNRPHGRSYQRDCTAILGDRECRFDVTQPGFSVELPVEGLEDGRRFTFEGLTDFEDRWFERGRLVVLGGAAAGGLGVIKGDNRKAEGRVLELWQSIRGNLQPGDMIRLEAGCDKSVSSCQSKFANFLNYRGFPHIPGEDWLTSYPTSSSRNDGGSLLK
ncbi:MAG: DUF2163 domain-containing protein [Pseudorhodobacter sp.]